MRALVMEGFGKPSQARLGELPEPAIGPDEILVHVAAVSLNPVDWKEMAGMLAGFYPPYPARWVPGFDGAGVVAAVGDGVSGCKPGDRVLMRPGRTHGNGVLAEYVRVQADKVARVPDGLSLAQAACLATGARTAYQAFFRPDVATLKPGQTVLVDGAAGGVGSYAIGIASAAGARTAGSCRKANCNYVRGLGAELAPDYASEDFVAQVRGWAPGGVDIVLDTQSGGQKAELLELLAPGGILVILATLTNDADIAALTAAAEAKGCRLHFLLMNYDMLAEDMRGLLPLLESGRMALPELQIYPFERAAEALQAVKDGGIRGKVVVEIAGLE